MRPIATDVPLLIHVFVKLAINVRLDQIISQRINVSLTLLSHGIVHAVPPRITEIPHNQEVTVSGRIELECAAEGLPTPVISWRVNSTEYPGTIPLRSYIRFTRRCITQRYAENGQLAFVSRILMDFRCIIIVVLFSSA